jgi:hypothetical protein
MEVEPTFRTSAWCDFRIFAMSPKISGFPRMSSHIALLSSQCRIAGRDIRRSQGRLFPNNNVRLRRSAPRTRVV